MNKIIAITAIAISAVVSYGDPITDEELEKFIEGTELITGWTAEELTQGLDNMEVLYGEVKPIIPLVINIISNRMQSAEGRAELHGPVTNTVVDTAEQIKSQYHADGYVHVEKFHGVVPGKIENQLSAAERAAKRKEREAKAAARKEAERQARIAVLTTNLTAEVSALMAKKNYPEELARLMLLHELNTLKGTNVVDAVVVPQN